MIFQHLDRSQQSRGSDFAGIDVRRYERLGLNYGLADGGSGVLPAKGQTALRRLTAGARRYMTFAPANSALSIAHLDDNRLDLGESPVGKNVGTDQWQPQRP